MNYSFIVELKKNLETARKQVEAYEALLLTLEGGKVTPTHTEHFSTALISLLKRNPTGLILRQIVEEVSRAGIQFKGKTDIPTRVSSELFRLKKKKAIRQDEDGRYRAA